jgi:hypothetical protein
VSHFDPTLHWHAQFKHLKPWTDIATKGLADESRARVLEEITAHFEDAIAQGVQRGHTEDEAARCAVADLGNPWRALCAFRRTNLTRFQAKTLRHMFAKPWLTAFVFLPMGLLVAARALQPLLGGGPRAAIDPVRIAVLAIVGLAFATRTVIAPRFFRRGFRRAAVGLAATAEFLLWTGFSVSNAGPITGNLWVVPIFLAIVVVGYLPLAIKIDRQQPEPVGDGSA